jgi:DNA-directed RNA polymerase subunit M/transcription elongation factor TFIIS
MEFCEICDNLMFLRSEEDTRLVKYCKHCGFSKDDTNTGKKAIKVAQTLYSEDDLLYLQFKNKYLRNDPTLPRVRDPTLVCPNRECTGPRDSPQVLYVKYHPVHMKYLYCCDYCGTMWRQETEKMM